MPIKLSFNSWAYSSFPVWVPAYPLDETIKRIARIGYDGIEIGAAAPHAFPDYLDANARREIKAVLADNNIALSSMLPAPGGGPGFNVSSPLAAERASAIDQYTKVARLCAEWGGKTLLYVAGWQIYGTSAEQAWDWSREALQVIARNAAEVGVTVAIEPTPTDSNLVESCDDAIRMMREVGRIRGMARRALPQASVGSPANLSTRPLSRLFQHTVKAEASADPSPCILCATALRSGRASASIQTEATSRSLEKLMQNNELGRGHVNEVNVSGH